MYEKNLHPVFVLLYLLVPCEVLLLHIQCSDSRYTHSGQVRSLPDMYCGPPRLLRAEGIRDDKKQLTVVYALECQQKTLIKYLELHNSDDSMRPNYDILRVGVFFSEQNKKCRSYIKWAKNKNKKGCK